MKSPDSTVSIPVPWVREFFDEQTHTFSYVVTDTLTRQCAIIDSVLNYNAVSATITTRLADHMVEFIQHHGLQVQWILETHVHADHLSAAPYLKSVLGGKIAISRRIDQVQQTFAAIYHLDISAIQAQQPFDHLFDDGEVFFIGSLRAYNIPTPGHTPACLSYVIGDAVFVGDTLFMPDYGTARCDFPNGSAHMLYESIGKLYALDDQTRVFLCHDYKPKQRASYQCCTTIGMQKQSNIHLNATTTAQEFIKLREQRDATLEVPQLMLPAIQVNMNGGKLPEAESNGIRYLKIPINYFSA